MPDVPLCVYCRRKPVEPAWKPFCSERCKMADLGRWLSGDYRVPGPPGASAGLDEADATPEDMRPPDEES